MAKAADIFTEITATIIASIEEGAATGNWTPPWRSQSSIPVNATTGKAYRGGNVIALWIDQLVNEYPTASYATFKQIQAAGGQVRRGEHGVHLVKWTPRPPCKTHAANELCDRCVGKPKLFPTSFVVFNIAQQDGFVPTASDAPALSEDERIAAAEEFFTNTGLDIRYGGGRAYYAPVQDYIALPAFADFVDAAAAYATLSHESIHATGHKDRLDRTFGKSFGDDTYAAEELVAEIGSAFLCAVLGISDVPRPDHAEYLTHWIGILKADPKVLFQAASKAQAAVDFLVSLQPALTSDDSADERLPDAVLVG